MAIPDKIIRNLNQDGIIRTMDIDLSDTAEDRAAVIEVLRSKLYSDKILAPIREYSTNARDSHVEAGVESEPIVVTLPTIISPEFRVRDFGIGLNPDEIEKIYIKYGRSTKRNTNSQTGQLGLGCKSAFAYGDNFIVVSYKEGMRTTYNLTINGICTVFASEPMDAIDKNGIEVIIPVKENDVREFQNKALEFFKYWKICPRIVGGDPYQLEMLRTELETKPLFYEESWEIRPVAGYSYGKVDGVVVMGNVPYPINWDLIRQKLNIDTVNNSSDEILFQFICSNKTILRVNIGELDFSASRESLEYTEKTCKNIIKQIRYILDSIFTILDDKIKSASSYWEALIIYNQIFGRHEDKIFKGDIYKLENYYLNKFSWNDITINSGQIEHLENWDRELGYSSTGKWKNADNYLISGHNPVLTVYDINPRNERIKQSSPNEYSNNRIPAKNNIRIIIHNLAKPVLVKSIIRYVFSEYKPNKVYHLHFKDDVQEKEFYDTMHFDSVPVIRASEIIDTVRTWIKANRASSGGTTQRDPQSVRCFAPKCRLTKYGYWDDITWDRDEVDIHEEEGYYVETQNGKSIINGDIIDSLSSVSHHVNILFNVLDEKVDVVYGLLERNYTAKWFGEAAKNGKWVKLDTYFKENEQQLIHGKAILAAKSIKYYEACNNNAMFGIAFVEKIIPRLKNKNGAMYKACIEVSSDFKTLKDFTQAMKFFGLCQDLAEDCDTDFNSLFESVKKEYPMLPLLEEFNVIISNSNDNRLKLSSSLINNIVNYVNMIDNQKISVATVVSVDDSEILTEKE